MQTLQLRDVFTAGGIPTVTYVAREEKDAEKQLDKYLITGNTILSITGPSKSGKTVLCRRKVPDDRRIDVAGGQTRDLNGFWHQIADALEVPLQSSKETESSTDVHFRGEAGGSADIGFAKVSIGGNADRVTTSKVGQSTARDHDLATSTLNAIVSSKRILVIDDFHFIPPDVQSQIIQALKQKILIGLNVIILSVPHRGFDVTRAERDINQRLRLVEIPPWSIAELKKIAVEGFRALNVEVSSEIIDTLAEEAYGSPILMQRFCQELCLQNNVLETLPEKTRIGHKHIDNVLVELARDQPSDLHEKIARGGGRAGERDLRKGGTADIYEVVLRAIVECLPETSISLDRIRAGVRGLLTMPPQNHEITRVLQKISELAQQAGSADPAIEWDGENRKLHIADPAFAFYLKWGYFQGRKNKPKK